ncbi:hypothetical protein [Undibacterium sp.]|jgi:uncharacterized membrane protein (GlpM family)|uniref:hypothetical protein n=1 Tax=Undibacterium sp. TaxID=1914977 RepID=UPI002B70B7C4|nr:hypothetical protein [Undibacterium sp.]HTD04508.1 hypothetical protein [Undibacterium sp.]
MLNILALKLLLVPSLIAAITLSGRRWGATVAGWLSAFPIVAGPILFFIAAERGVDFARSASEGTMSAVIAILVFGLAYSWAATRFAWYFSLCCGFIAYALAVYLLTSLSPSLSMTTPVVFIALYLSPNLFPAVESTGKPPSASRFDLPMRMGIGALLVLSVTYFAATLGPRLSGLFAMFPVMSTVLVVFSHRSAGSGFAIHLLRGMVYGWYSFATFCLVLHLALLPLGIAGAFPAALTAAVVVQIASRRLLQQSKAC